MRRRHTIFDFILRTGVLLFGVYYNILRSVQTTIEFRTSIGIYSLVVVLKVLKCGVADQRILRGTPAAAVPCTTPLRRAIKL